MEERIRSMDFPIATEKGRSIQQGIGGITKKYPCRIRRKAFPHRFTIDLQIPGSYLVFDSAALHNPRLTGHPIDSKFKSEEDQAQAVFFGWVFRPESSITGSRPDMDFGIPFRCGFFPPRGSHP